MHSDLFTCCICSLDYDPTYHLPKVLPACGHTLCLACLHSILSRQLQPSCPLDRTPFEHQHNKSVDTFPTNVALLNIIEERLKTVQKLCTVHREQKDYVCLTDRHMICRSCLQGKHRSHKVLHVSDVKAKALLKEKQLQVMVDDFDLWKETLDEQVNSAKKSMLRTSQTMVKVNYGRREVNTEADLLFALKKLELEEKLKRDIALREKIIKKICLLGQGVINGEFLEVLEEEMPNFEFQDEDSSLSVFIEELRSQFNGNDSSFYSPIKQVQFVNLPQFDLLEDVLTPFTSDTAQEMKNDSWKELFKVECLNDWLFVTNNDTKSGGAWSLSIEKLSVVTKVNLEFAKNTISQDMLQGLQGLWEELKEITHLKVNFLNKDLTDSELSMFFSHPFWATEELESLEIDLEECNISDGSVMILMNDVLPKMTGLNSIELRLGETNIKDASIQAFNRSALPVFENLERFNLNLYGTSVSDISISQLLFGLKDVVQNLKSFALGLSKTKITEISVYLLAESVLPLMSELESLELYVCDVAVTDSSASQLFHGIKQGLMNIKNLLVNLGNTKITDKTVDIFSKDILPCLESIEHVELFFYNTLVSDVSVEQIVNKLSILKEGAKELNINCEQDQVVNKKIGVKLNEALISRSLKLDRLCC